MSAIARYFKHNGRNVSGYDRTPSPLTAKLEQEGIQVHYEDRPDLIPFDIDNTFVIYTPAVPEDLEEFKYVREKGYAICKRSRALGQITAGKDCLAVAGTHGKTTTSTLLAQHPSGPHPHLRPGRMQRIPGRHIQELPYQPAAVAFRRHSSRSRRVRPILPAASSRNRRHHGHRRRPS